jgi:hypothetical protein
LSQTVGFGLSWAADDEQAQVQLQNPLESGLKLHNFISVSFLNWEPNYNTRPGLSG